MLVSAEQPEKACSLIWVTEPGIVMSVRLVQPWKARQPMDVTELGMSMAVSVVQPWKARSPIAVTEVGMVVFWQPTARVLDAVSMMALQSFRESKFGLSLATVRLVNLVQPENAYSPMRESELPMWMLVNAEHPVKA